MNTDLLTQDDLYEWTGYDSPGHLARFLERSGIPYRRAKGGAIVTERGAVTQALLKTEKANNDDWDDFEVG